MAVLLARLASVGETRVTIAMLLKATVAVIVMWIVMVAVPLVLEGPEADSD